MCGAMLNDPVLAKRHHEVPLPYLEDVYKFARAVYGFGASLK